MPRHLPVLYSFRRCPYAIRARLAIAYARIPVEIREITLKHKPEQMLAISPKGTVPVLQLQNGKVINESLDIMYWALSQNDPDHWLFTAKDAKKLIQRNDGDFKHYLDRYKYADRYPEFTENYYRQQAESFLTDLENKLSQHQYLSGSRFSLVDAAILPFIRQFAAVDRRWFLSSDYQHLNRWLDTLLTSDLFDSVMTKRPVWQT
jgi:glutathione S-transferase